MYNNFTPNELYHIAIASILLAACIVVVLYSVRLIGRTFRESWKLAFDLDAAPPHASLRAGVSLVLLTAVINAGLSSRDLWQLMAPEHSREWFAAPITSPVALVHTLLIGVRAALRAVAAFEFPIALAVLAFAIFALVLRTDWVSRAAAAVSRGVQLVRRSRAAEPKSLTPKTSGL